MAKKSKDKLVADLPNCRWFSRGWTLQKLILSHTHILLFLNERHAFTEPERIDNTIRAELPDRDLDLDGSLTEIVENFMVHGYPTASYTQKNISVHAQLF